MTKSFKLLGVAIVAALPMTALSDPKTATCEVYTADDSYKGKCIFQSEKGGSFSIKKPKGEILDGISDISVYVVKKGVAEVSGLTTYGNNSRWGTAVRSSSDKACWIGDDFTICVR